MHLVKKFKITLYVNDKSMNNNNVDLLPCCGPHKSSLLSDILDAEIYKIIIWNCTICIYKNIDIKLIINMNEEFKNL